MAVLSKKQTRHRSFQYRLQHESDDLLPTILTSHRGYLDYLHGINTVLCALLPIYPNSKTVIVIGCYITKKR